MRKMMIVTMNILLVLGANAYADTTNQSAQTGDQLQLTGEDKSDRFKTAQATDSTMATLATLSKTEYEGKINGWDVTVAPYAWLAAIDATVTTSGIQTDLDLSFNDILDNFDLIAFSTRVEAWKEKKGFILDVGYLELGTDIDVAVLNVDVDIEDFNIVLSGGYRILDEHTGDNGKHPVTLDGIVGLRYHYLKQKIKITGPAPTINLGGSKDWVEPVVGGRVKVGLSDKWTWVVIGDIGGFGIGSASDLSWGLLTGFGYKINERFESRFGYRHFDIDYSNGSGSNEFGMDGSMDGIYVALGIGF